MVRQFVISPSHATEAPEQVFNFGRRRANDAAEVKSHSPSLRIHFARSHHDRTVWGSPKKEAGSPRCNKQFAHFRPWGNGMEEVGKLSSSSSLSPLEESILRALERGQLDKELGCGPWHALGRVSYSVP